MFYYFLFYTFLIPLQYLQDKIPKGPTGINYLTLSMIILVIWLLFGRKRSGGRILTPTSLNIILFLFIIDTCVGYIITFMTVEDASSSFDPGGLHITQFLQLATGFMLFWIGANMLNTRRRIMWTLLAIASTAPIAFRAFYNSLGYVASFHYDHDMRITFPFTQIGSNELGCFFVYTSTFFLLLAFAPMKGWLKAVFWLVGGMYAYGVLFSLSRASHLGFAIAMGCGACMRYRWLIIGFIMAGVTMEYWIPQAVIERWEMTTGESGELDESAESRKRYWVLAKQLFMQDPIMGHGTGSFRKKNPEAMDAHNEYYNILAEQGIIGILLFISIWISVIKLACDLWRKGGDTVYKHYGLCIGLITLSLLVMNLFGDRFSYLAMIGQYWILVGIGVRLRAHLNGSMPLDDEKRPLPAGSYLQQFFALPVDAPHSGLEDIGPGVSGLQGEAAKRQELNITARSDPSRGKNSIRVVGQPGCGKHR